MADKKGYDELVGRAVNDTEFRQRLLAEPEATISAEGFEVEAEVVEKLKAIDPAAAEAAARDIDGKFGGVRTAG